MIEEVRELTIKAVKKEYPVFVNSIDFKIRGAARKGQSEYSVWPGIPQGDRFDKIKAYYECQGFKVDAIRRGPEVIKMVISWA
jgi:hypothetical protein